MSRYNSPDLLQLSTLTQFIFQFITFKGIESILQLKRSYSFFSNIFVIHIFYIHVFFGNFPVLSIICPSFLFFTTVFLLLVNFFSFFSCYCTFRYFPANSILFLSFQVISCSFFCFLFFLSLVYQFIQLDLTFFVFFYF